MITIALVAAKGGVGKSSLAAALAIAAAPDTPGTTVALLDLDPQGSLTRWWNPRALPQPILADLAGQSLAGVQRKLPAIGLDYLILDCPPGISRFQREAIRAADLVLVPIGASVLDLAAVASTAEMADQAGVPLLFVLNRAVFRSRLAGRAVAELRERGRLLWPPIHLRVAVAAAMAAGRTDLETEPGGAGADGAVARRADQPSDADARRPARRAGRGGPGMSAAARPTGGLLHRKGEAKPRPEPEIRPRAGDARRVGARPPAYLYVLFKA
jgi:chromosome partitioning protein